MPTFLIDTIFDEVSPDRVPYYLCFTEFRTCFTEFNMPIQANRTLRIGQNSVKYRPTASTSASPLQYASELHQKDLRINLEYCHILGLRTEANLRADTLLALSLIVGFYVSRGSIMPRRVVISVIRPCKVSEHVRYLSFMNI